jgi:hypothetical protein
LSWQCAGADQGNGSGENEAASFHGLRRIEVRQFDCEVKASFPELILEVKASIRQ